MTENEPKSHQCLQFFRFLPLKSLTASKIAQIPLNRHMHFLAIYLTNVKEKSQVSHLLYEVNS